MSDLFTPGQCMFCGEDHTAGDCPTRPRTECEQQEAAARDLLDLSDSETPCDTCGGIRGSEIAPCTCPQPKDNLQAGDGPDD